MKSDWILDVLADLKSFACSNNLPILAEHLEDVEIIALAEIASYTSESAIGYSDKEEDITPPQ